MKKITGLVLLAFSLLACKKHTTNTVTPRTPVNIVLENKPLDTIRYYTNGQWQLRIMEGGIGGIKEYPSNTYLIFSDIITWYDSASSYTFRIDTVKTPCIYGDSTYLMQPLTGGNNDGQIIGEIINDSLYISDNHPDGFTYVFTKRVEY